jgi:hypothetical protein
VFSILLSLFHHVFLKLLAHCHNLLVQFLVLKNVGPEEKPCVAPTRHLHIFSPLLLITSDSAPLLRIFFAFLPPGIQLGDIFFSFGVHLGARRWSSISCTAASSPAACLLAERRICGNTHVQNVKKPHNVIIHRHFSKDLAFNNF